MRSILEMYQKCDFPPTNAKQAFWMSILFTALLLIIIFVIFNEISFQLIIALIYTIVFQFFILDVFWKYCTPGKPQDAKKINWTPEASEKFKLQEIILKEFDYARETATQAMSDRHTLVNFFLIITGVTITAASSLIAKQDPSLSIDKLFLLEIACLLFLMIGWIYFIKIIRLRQAWNESATAMNQIKTFFIKHSEVPVEISVEAFRWQQCTLPKPEKKSTIFYYSALLIAFISSIALSVAWFSAMYPNHLQIIDWFPLMVGFYHFFFQRQMYSIFLAPSRGKK